MFKGIFNEDKLSLEELNNLKKIIINNNLLELPNKYKSFTAYDYSYAKKTNGYIKFIIDKTNILYGIDENMRFYIGKVFEADDTNFILFRYDQNETENVFVLFAIFSKDTYKLSEDYWSCSSIKTTFCLNAIEKTNNNSLLYNEIVDEKIENLTDLICLSYIKNLNTHKNLLDLINKISNTSQESFVKVKKNVL